MERRAVILSFVLSFLAMFLVYQYVSTEDEQLKKDFGTFYSMVVASRDILQFETIRPTDLEVVRVPAAMASFNRIENPQAVIDSVAAIPISKGEHILDNKIISKNVYSGLDTQISVGRRALSIPVTPKSSVGYMIRPGNRVDLSAHFEYKASSAAISEVKVFMQDLLVLAAGRTIQSTAPKGVDQSFIKGLFKDYSKASPQELTEAQETLNFAKNDVNFLTVTLEVTPEQAQQIVYVQSVFGDSIQCILRHPDDRQIAAEKTTNLFTVMGDDSYLVRGNKVQPMRAVPRPKFFDYVGEQSVPVY